MAGCSAERQEQAVFFGCSVEALEQTATNSGRQKTNSWAFRQLEPKGE